jgi:CheY-like chemotaxis protein
MESPDKPVVLIAEDDSLISINLELILTEAGFGFLSVGTAQEAIDALEEDSARFCALLTDIRMPGKANGWDAARRARQLQPILPIVYMTGDSAEQWRAQGVPGSMLLQKPFADAQLVTALTTLINEAGIDGSANSP